jgi:hypothetical protein
VVVAGWHTNVSGPPSDVEAGASRSGAGGRPEVVDGLSRSAPSGAGGRPEVVEGTSRSGGIDDDGGGASDRAEAGGGCIDAPGARGTGGGCTLGAGGRIAGTWGIDIARGAMVAGRAPCAGICGIDIVRGAPAGGTGGAFGATLGTGGARGGTEGVAGAIGRLEAGDANDGSEGIRGGATTGGGRVLTGGWLDDSGGATMLRRSGNVDGRSPSTSTPSGTFVWPGTWICRVITIA